MDFDTFQWEQKTGYNVFIRQWKLYQFWSNKRFFFI